MHARGGEAVVRTRAPARRLLVLLVGLGAVVAAWALATPPMAYPDAPSHVFASAAVVRGEFGGRLVTRPGGVRIDEVEVPPGLAALAPVADCLVASTDASPTSCARATVGRRDVAVPTQFMRYPPIFYLLSGWPSLLLRGTSAYRAMTLAAAGVDVALLSIGAWTLRGHPRLVVGWWLASTPTLLFFAGTQSSSGPELCAALTLWVVLLTVLTRRVAPRIRDAAPPAEERRRTAVDAEAVTWSEAGAASTAFAAMVLARPEGALLAPLVVLTALAAVGNRRTARLIKQRAVQAGGVAAGAALVAAGILRVVQGAPIGILAAPASPQAFWHVARVLVEHATLSDVTALFGTFLNYSPPTALRWLWLVGLVCLATSTRLTVRLAATALLLILAIVVVPPLADAAAFDKEGVWFQMRYLQPLLLGIPLLLAGAGRVAPEPSWRRLPRVVALVCATTSAAGGFVATLHRYVDGAHRGWWGAPQQWHPTGGAVVLTAAFVVGCACICWATGGAGHRRAAGGAERRRMADAGHRAAHAGRRW